MRTLVRISLDVEAGNAAIKSGRLPKLIEDAVKRLSPEASYFFPEHGKRTAMFVCDLKDSSEIPAIAEPFFLEGNATVELYPVMNLDELTAGLNRATANAGASTGFSRS